MVKNFTYLSFKHSMFLLIIVLFSACEDVIDIETPSEPPRLIVDAIVRVDENEPFFGVEVKVSQTSNFFDENETISIESMTIIVQIKDDNGIVTATGVSTLLETADGSGIYVPTPEDRLTTSLKDVNAEYFLIIRTQEEVFVGITKYVPTVPIDTVVQGDGTIFDEDDTEVIITFTDEPDREDFYVFDFSNGNFIETEDTFYPGQQFTFSYFFDDNVEPGDMLDISILGADEAFYNYMSQIIEQSEGAFGPFSTPTATVRGNIINATDIDNDDVFDNLGDTNNFALGYFAIVQEFKETIIIE